MARISILAVIFASIAVVKGAKTHLGLSESVFNQLVNKGYTMSDIESLVGTIRSSLLSVKDEQIGQCGEGLKGLLDRQLIPGDPDALERVSGIIHQGSFQLFRGKLPIVTLPSASILLPVDSISDTCFGIRSDKGIGYNVCTKNRNMRNTWMNAISEMVLCEKTGVRSGRLPAISKKQNVLAGSNVGELRPSGIDIVIKDSNQGKPFLTINGKPVSQIIQKQVMAAQNALTSPQNEESEEDSVEIPAEVEGSASQDMSGGSILTDSEKLAILESDAEHLMLPIGDAPPTGYASVHMGGGKRNKTILKLEQEKEQVPRSRGKERKSQNCIYAWQLKSMNWQLELEKKLEKVKENEDLWIVIEDGIVEILEREERESEPTKVGKSLIRRIFEILKGSLKDNNWSCCNSCLRFVWTLIQYNSLKYSDIDDRNIKVLMNVYYSVVAVSQTNQVVELEFATLLRNITGFFMSWVDDYYLEISKTESGGSEARSSHEQTPVFIKDKVMLEKYINSLFELLTMIEPKRSNCNGVLEYLYIGHSFILSSRYAAETYTMIQQISAIQKSSCYLPSELMESCVKRFLSCPDFDLQLILGELIWRVIKKSGYGRGHSQGDYEELSFIEIFRSSWPEGLIQLRYIGTENFDYSFRGLLTPWNKTCNGNGRNIWSLSGILIQMQGLEIKLVTVVDICAFSIVFHSDIDDEESQSSQSRHSSCTSNTEEKDLKPFVSTAEIPYWTIKSVVYDDHRNDLQINIVFSEILEIKQSWTGIFSTNIENLQSQHTLKNDILRVSLSIDEEQAYQIMGIFKASKVEKIHGTKHIETPSRKVSMVDSRAISIKELNKADQTNVILESVENRYKSLENVKVSIVTSKITPSKSQLFSQQLEDREKRVSFISSKDCSHAGSERKDDGQVAKKPAKESTKLESKANVETQKKGKADAIILGLLNEQKKLTQELESTERSPGGLGSGNDQLENENQGKNGNSTSLLDERGEAPQKAVNKSPALKSLACTGEELKREANKTSGSLEAVKAETNQVDKKEQKDRKAPKSSKSRVNRHPKGSKQETESKQDHCKSVMAERDQEQDKDKKKQQEQEQDKEQTSPRVADQDRESPPRAQSGNGQLENKTQVKDEVKASGQSNPHKKEKRPTKVSCKPKKLKGGGKSEDAPAKKSQEKSESAPKPGSESAPKPESESAPKPESEFAPKPESEKSQLREPSSGEVERPVVSLDQTNKRASGLKRGRFNRDRVDLASREGVGDGKVGEVVLGVRVSCPAKSQRLKDESEVSTPVLKKSEAKKVADEGSSKQENLKTVLTMAEETTCPTRRNKGGKEGKSKKQGDSESIVPLEIAVVDNEYPILAGLDEGAESQEIEVKKRRYSSDSRSDKLLSMWMSEIKGGEMCGSLEGSSEERTPRVISIGPRSKRKGRAKQRSRSKIKQVSEGEYRLEEGGAPDIEVDSVDNYVEETKSVIFSGIDQLLEKMNGAGGKESELGNSVDPYDSMSCVTGTEVLENMLRSSRGRGLYDFSLKSLNSIGKMSIPDSIFSPDVGFDDGMTVANYSVVGGVRERGISEQGKDGGELPVDLCISKVRLEENKQLETALTKLEATSKGLYDKCQKRLESYFVSVKKHIESMWSERIGLFSQKRRDLSLKVEATRAQIEKEYLSLQSKYVLDLQDLSERIQRERASLREQGSKEGPATVGKSVLAELREEVEREKSKVERSIQSLSEKKEIERNRYRKSTTRKLDLKQILKKMIVSEESE
ncbi:putative coiled coil-containing protein [Cryptosporidium canis]|uniref:Coiled coil-containing protein n=1 Tax=Cryptosporidium canis TaxID=195482 RepID=A0ABQ8PA64_9CRYT|nr:putative coiled coil-containing protein [Cryptosporidium canis]